MSFENLMNEWAAGKRSSVTCKDVFYEIRANTDALQECEVLHRGIDAFEDIVLTKDHIFWLRDQENKFRCCYFMENSYRELNFKQLDVIFGDIIRNGGIVSNKQLLSNGIEVPIVPEFFINEVRTKHEQKKRRVLYAQKIKKKNLREMNSMLWFYNMDAAPTHDECFESVHVIPPNIFTKSKEVGHHEEVTVELRERTIQLFQKTRSKILNHPLYAQKLQNNVFNDISSVTDLLKLSVEDTDGNKINIAQHVIALFHILVPLNSE